MAGRSGCSEKTAFSMYYDRVTVFRSEDPLDDGLHTGLYEPTRS